MLPDLRLQWPQHFYFSQSGLEGGVNTGICSDADEPDREMSNG